MHISPLLGPVVAMVAWTTLFRIATALIGIYSRTRDRRRSASPVENGPYRLALFEQPSRFYAIVFALVLMGFDAWINVWLAWAYVAFRVARDLVEATFNHRQVRFILFVGATASLVCLITHAVLRLLHS